MRRGGFHVRAGILLAAGLAIVLWSGCDGSKKKRSSNARPAAEAAEDPGTSAEAAPGPKKIWQRKKRAPGAGPRAPFKGALGVQVAGMTLAGAKAHTARLGLECRDLGMKASKERIKARIAAEAKAQPEQPTTDATSSASKKKGGGAGNPQVRWACSKVPTLALADRTRPDATGRLLFVFDDPDTPLRHVSLSHSMADHAAALKDVQAAVAFYTATFGEPTKQPSDLPKPDAEGKVVFQKLMPYNYTWAFADFEISLRAMSPGGSVNVQEGGAVPHEVWVVPPRD